MTELLEPDDRQEALESDDEEQYGRDLLVQAFFFIAFAGIVVLLFHWLTPWKGWQLYAGASLGSYYASWLFRKFRDRG
jgi:hypothetical protein